MNEFGFLVLKGRYIIAQGKRRRSVALGWRMSIRIVRAITSIKENILFLDETENLMFPENGVPQFRPKQQCRPAQYFSTDGFSPASLTQGGVSVRSSRNSTLG